MTVNPGGDGQAAVSQLLADKLQVGAGFEKHCGISMPEGMKGSVAEKLLAPTVKVPDIIGSQHFSGTESTCEVSVYIERTGPETVQSLAVFGDFQERKKSSGERDAASGGLGFRYLLRIPLITIYRCSVDIEFFLAQIYIGPLQRTAFSDPQSGIVGDPDRKEKLIFLRKIGKHFIDFGRRKNLCFFRSCTAAG